METIATFQERLIALLKEKKITQKELSDLTGISRSLINKYIKGISNANQKKLNLIAKATNVNPVWLLGFDVPMENLFGIREEIDTLLSSPLLTTEDMIAIKSFVELYINNLEAKRGTQHE